jgi:hypothetical protein
VKKAIGTNIASGCFVCSLVNATKKFHQVFASVFCKANTIRMIIINECVFQVIEERKKNMMKNGFWERVTY